MGNVELFELCETIPKVQCSECLLYWNQGVIYCTYGHLLVESESSQHFHQWRLDALSIPHCVIRMGRPRGARHGKTEAQKEHFVDHNARTRCSLDSTPRRIGSSARFLSCVIWVWLCKPGLTGSKAALVRSASLGARVHLLIFPPQLD